MPRPMTRAERYKRNYRIIKNTYQDSKLAKKAQSWSDERIYNDLGVNVKRSTPDLREVDESRKSYYRSKLKKTLYGIGGGIDPELARKISNKSYAVIDSGIEYKKVFSKRRTKKNIQRRFDLWNEWSLDESPMPPQVKREAERINRNTKLASGRALDKNAHYGYAKYYYMFIEDYTEEELDNGLLYQDPHDADKLRGEFYRTVVTI